MLERGGSTHSKFAQQLRTWFIQCNGIMFVSLHFDYHGLLLHVLLLFSFCLFFFYIPRNWLWWQYRSNSKITNISPLMTNEEMARLIKRHEQVKQELRQWTNSSLVCTTERLKANNISFSVTIIWIYEITFDWYNWVVQHCFHNGQSWHAVMT